MAPQKSSILLLTLCCLWSAAFCDQNCPQNWHFHGGHCYSFGEDEVTWADAEETCEIYGAKLAEVETAEENTFLKNMAKMKVAPAVWLGGTDIFSEGDWEWVSTRQPMYGFADWAPNEPNQADSLGGEDCLQLYRHKNYQWNDKNCGDAAFFICEAEPLTSVIG